MFDKAHIQYYWCLNMIPLGKVQQSKSKYKEHTKEWMWLSRCLPSMIHQHIDSHKASKRCHQLEPCMN